MLAWRNGRVVAGGRVSGAAATARRRRLDPLLGYAVPRTDEPSLGATLERHDSSYVVTVAPMGAELTFRDVRVDGGLSADVTIAHRGRFILRSGAMAMGLAGRDTLARTAYGLTGKSATP